MFNFEKLSLLFFGGLKPRFYSVFSNMQNVKTQKLRFVNTFVLTVLVQMSVFFCIFRFGGFRNFQFFVRDVFGNHNSKMTKIQSNKKNNNNSKNKTKNKKYIILWLKTKKENKLKNKNKRTSWNKNKQNRNKTKNQKLKRETESHVWHTPKHEKCTENTDFHKKQKETNTKKQTNKTNQKKQSNNNT